MELTGSCFCRRLAYKLELDSPDDARTSVCHCKNCKKAFGTTYGLTSKVAKDAFKYTKGTPKEFKDEASGVTREFCDHCGSYILEYGEQVQQSFRYICVGSLDDPEALPPKGEFFCKSRASWMPEIPNVFHKQEIKE
ncbi:hypothetical protein P152DRAFT_454659 [Eremomyces bilateralis CBS 781.70]|uniref:CENP-V/GFA domain-containing protein n=1 Tax=Eremomyces bilateralis CBS 781.70 TaxID=1392243 RepID=A0A6G1GEU2_9PEZI|nr:uncharacterized protein P152DRAFT_454659 [Eremomyces bilateralis CBS 781.70]KAF1816390.1 hypothetical protein P152DRAFT_454659 [Eremomyces bilateralis CBS 781.70]